MTVLTVLKYWNEAHAKETKPAPTASKTHLTPFSYPTHMFFTIVALNKGNITLS